MEVHHHSHHPKKWKEYISEFLMLFLAVFSGFMAESYLEYRTDRHKEHDYLTSLVSDLKIDTADMNRKTRNLGFAIHNADRLAAIIFEDNWMKNKADSTYIMSSRIYGTELQLQYAEGTFDQLKNAGGLRLIRNKELVEKIKLYIKDQKRLKDHQTEVLSNLSRMVAIHEKLFYNNIIMLKGKFLEDHDFDANRENLATINKKTGSMFLSNNQNDFYNYSNVVKNVSGYLIVHKALADEQNHKAIELINLIQEELNH